MALTNEQKLKCRLLLQAGRGELDDLFLELTAEDEAEVGRILAAAANIELSSTKINAEGVSIDPAETRRLLAERLAVTLDYVTDPGVRIGRA